MANAGRRCRAGEFPNIPPGGREWRGTCEAGGLGAGHNQEKQALELNP